MSALEKAKAMREAALKAKAEPKVELKREPREPRDVKPRFHVSEEMWSDLMSRLESMSTPPTTTPTPTHDIVLPTTDQVIAHIKHMRVEDHLRGGKAYLIRHNHERTREVSVVLQAVLEILVSVLDPTG